MNLRIREADFADARDAQRRSTRVDRRAADRRSKFSSNSGARALYRRCGFDDSTVSRFLVKPLKE
jgi:hypothetical protein